MKMRWNGLLCLAAVLCLSFGPALADENKEMLVRLCANMDRSKLEALVIDGLFTLELSPEWWERMNEQKGFADGRKPVLILARSVIDMAKDMGWGDLKDMDYKTGRGADSPPVKAMVESWKDKLSVKVVMTFAPDEKSAAQSLQNIDYVGAPIQNDYYCKPRAGKFFLTVRVEPMVTDFKSKVSADGSSYEFILPAYAQYSQGKVEEALRLGQ